MTGFLHTDNNSLDFHSTVAAHYLITGCVYSLPINTLHLNMFLDHTGIEEVELGKLNDFYVEKEVVA